MYKAYRKVYKCILNIIIFKENYFLSKQGGTYLLFSIYQTIVTEEESNA